MRNIRLAVAVLLVVMSYPAGELCASERTVPSITGWLQIIWGDGRQGTPEPDPIHLLTTDDGTTVRLLIDTDVARSVGGVHTLYGERITVFGTAGTGNGPEGEGTLRVAAIRRAPEGSGKEAITGAQPWVSLLCRFQDVLAEPKALSFFQNMYASSHPGLDHYWQEQSFGLANTAGSDAFGWYVLPHPRSHYVYDSNGDGTVDVDRDALTTDCTALADPYVDFGNFGGINLMLNANLDCCAWGGARFLTLDGVSRVWRMTWNPPWAYADITVIGHEMGHGFGLPHSSGTYGETYDNEWDVMSDTWSNCSRVTDATYGCLGQHTVGYHKDKLGWIAADKKFISPGGSRTITLEQLATPQTENYLLAQIPIGDTGRFYTVEARRQSGYDFKLPSQGVIIHEVDVSRTRPAQVVDADGNGDTGDAGAVWTVGETFTDSLYQISVKVNSATATGFSVTLTTPIPTTTTLTSSSNPSLLNTSVTFTATVTPATPGTLTGAVTFRDGQTSLGNRVLVGGKASLTTSALMAGTHSITATYVGNNTYGGSVSPVLAQNVVRSAITVNDVSVIEGNSGQVNATFTVSRPAGSEESATVFYSTSDGTAVGGRVAFNSSPISLTHGNGSPYPSSVDVAGVTGAITKVTVSLQGFSHSFPRDVDVLLVGPGNQSVVLMSDVGSNEDAANLTFTFDDAAASMLPTNVLASGSFRPTNINDGEGTDVYPPPAPATGYGSALSVFNGTAANGTWNLFVADDFGGDDGLLAGGWTITIVTAGGGDYLATNGILTFDPGVLSRTISVAVIGDTVAETNETFSVILNNATNAVITDGIGQATIANDDGTAAAPANVVATAAGTSSVHLTWTAAANAGRYFVYRSSDGTLFTQVGTTITTAAFTDGTVSPNTSYLYKVRSVASAESPDSNVDLATTVVFTDSVLAAGSTRLKRAHFDELLTAVNAVRTLAVLTPAAFSAPAPAASAPVRRQHLLDLRTGLDGARTKLALPAVSYTDPTITAGVTKIKAAHIQDVRNGVR